jgi:hypothetical protein
MSAERVLCKQLLGVEDVIGWETREMQGHRELERVAVVRASPQLVSAPRPPRDFGRRLDHGTEHAIMIRQAACLT